MSDPSNNPAPTATCKHCGRAITREIDTWIDTEATGDDAIWREACDSHDTFVAEHEPDENIVEPDPALVELFNRPSRLSNTNPGRRRVPGHGWHDTLNRIETSLMMMDRDDRNDAIEALRSRFDELYDRDDEADEHQWYEAFNANTDEWVDLRTLDADALHWWERAADEAGDEGVVTAIRRITEAEPDPAVSEHPRPSIEPERLDDPRLLATDYFDAEQPENDPEPIRTWTYSQVNPGGADVTNKLTFTGTDAEWNEHLAELTQQGIEVFNAYTRII